MGLTAKKVYAVLNGKIEKVSSDVASLGTVLFYAVQSRTKAFCQALLKLERFTILIKIPYMEAAV